MDHTSGPHRPHRGPRWRRVARWLAAGGLAATTALAGGASSFGGEPAGHTATTTPIQHLMVIFQENVSFDHYFGTYPHAANTDGTPFHTRRGTPTVNGLTGSLLTANPNAANPRRIPATMPLTCDQDHQYTAEQKAFDGGLMDAFIENTNVDSCSAPTHSQPGLVLNYYDGNTVTALWNYAQRFAMSDNSFATVFGPSTPGAINLVSGQTHGGYAVTPDGVRVTDPEVVTAADASGIGTVIDDPEPAFDDCSGSGNPFVLAGRNVGDLLDARGITWGWFQGGFRPTATTGGRAVCDAAHPNVGGRSVRDYSAHHEPFQYYASTANPHHLPPSSPTAIGYADQANHQYDLSDFRTALAGGHLPAVSFLKAAASQDGHAGYSGPIDEQRFLVDTVNAVQRSPQWSSTAVIIAYDDSDGWYDHVMPPIVNTSHDPATDALNGPGRCGSPGREPLGGYPDRCGYGPRLPLLVISPYARRNAVDSRLTDQTSILRFIEDNWRTGRIGDASFDAVAGSLDGMFDFTRRSDDKLILSPDSGAVVAR